MVEGWEEINIGRTASRFLAYTETYGVGIISSHLTGSENGGSETGNDLLEVTQHVSGRAWILTQVCLSSKPVFFFSMFFSLQFSLP